MSGFIKRAAAAVLTAVMILTASACGEDDKKVGNLGDIKDEQEGDIYAVIKIVDYGDITAKLFPTAAPESVKRFTELAERGYYDGKTIHRVIKDYAIQGGSLNGDGSDGNVPESQYVPIETSEVTYNFYGALCFAASKKGSYSQFYIVDNDKPQDIDAVIEKLTSQLADEAITSRLLEKDKKQYEDYLAKLKAIPEAVKEKYARVGGLYQLDGENTVFGQVIDGFDVIDKITSVEVVSGNKLDDAQNIASKPIDSIIIETVEIVRIEPEVTEETTTTKKPSKTKKTEQTDKVNAETLPTAGADSDTTVDGAADTSIDTTTTPEAAEQPAGEVSEDTVAAAETTAASEKETAEPALLTLDDDIEIYEGPDLSDDEVVVIES